MTKITKLIYVIGSAIIGLAATLGIFTGLVATGAIESDKTKVVFLSADAEAEYSGEALTCESWSIVGGELKKGHEAKVSFTGSQTNVGTRDNDYYVSVFDANGKDVSDEYELECRKGKLSVLARRLTVVSASAEKVYDGKPLKSYEYEITEGDLVGSHYIDIEYKNAITEVGVIENEIAVKIFDLQDNDVTQNYEAICRFGTLTVSKRAIILRSDDAEKVYDGTELVEENYSLDAETPLAEGEELAISHLSSLIDVGTVANEFSVTVTDADGNDKTKNYEIAKEEGTLTITPREVTVYTFGASRVYNGEVLTNADCGFDASDIVEGHTAYLETDGAIVNVGETDNTCYLKVLDENDKDVSSNYAFSDSSTFGKLIVEKRSVNFDSNGDSKKYDGTPLTVESVSAEPYDEYNNSGICYSHNFVADFEDGLTDAGEKENRFTVVIFDENGDDVTDNYRINYGYGSLQVYKRTIAIRTYDDDKPYDGTPLTCDGYEIVDGYDGTAPDESLSVDVVGSITEIGERKNEFSVTVTNDITGRYTTFNYDFITDYQGVLEVYGKLEIVSKDYSDHYDGQTHFGKDLPNGGYSVRVYNGADTYTEYDGNSSGISDLPGGNSLFVNVFGSQKEVGYSLNEFSFEVRDSAGGDVTSKYRVASRFGVLIVEKRPITVRSKDLSKTYDGTQLRSTSAGDVSVVAGSLVEGHSLVPEFFGNITTAGATQNSFKITITEGWVDHTDCYDITYEYGNLTVDRRKVTLRSPDGGKTYDGATYVYTDDDDEFYALNDGALCDGDVPMPEFFATASAKAGSYANKFTANIYSYSLGKYVTDSYDISYDYGTSFIRRKPITVSCDEVAEFVYDGTEHAYDGETPVIRDPNDALWHFGGIVTPTFTGKLTKVGEAPNLYTVRLREYGEDSTDNYEIEYRYGTLKVTQRPLTIASGSAEKNYDGEPLYCSDWSVDGELGEGDVIETVTLDATITEVGKISNKIGKVKILNSDDEDVTYCYDIERDAGYLTVKGTGDPGDPGGDPGDPGGGTGGGSGPDGSDIRGGYNNSEAVVLTVNANTSGAVYLKTLSRGDYDYENGFQDAPVYDKSLYDADIDKSVPLSYLTYYTLDENGEFVSDIAIRSYGNIYVIPYYAAPYATDICNDVYAYGTPDGVYHFGFIRQNYIYTGVNSAYSVDEAEYRFFVYDNYLGIKGGYYTVCGNTDTTYGFLTGIINDNDLDKGDLSASIRAIGDFLNVNNRYDKDYKINSSLDDVDNSVLYFLLDPSCKGGVCRHFALAGTLLLRAMGYPARYTVGYLTSVVAGQDKDVLSKNAHAWCEVYVDGVGWMIAEFTPPSGSGGGTGGGGDGGGVDEEDADAIDLTLSLNPIYHPYHLGETHFEVEADASSGIIVGFDYYRKMNCDFHAVIACDYDEAGVNSTYIKSIEFTDNRGEPTTKFIANEPIGVAYLYLYELRITGSSASKPYDGTPLTLDDDAYTVETRDAYDNVVSFPAEYSMDIVFYGSQTEIATSPNYFSVTITDNASGNDASEYFYVRKYYGILTIDRIPIRVAAPDITVSEVSVLADNGTMKAISVDITYNGAIQNEVYLVESDNSLERKIVLSGADVMILVGGVVVRTYENAYSVDGAIIAGHTLVVSYNDFEFTEGQYPKNYSATVKIKDEDVDVTKDYYSIKLSKGKLTIA